MQICWETVRYRATENNRNHLQLNYIVNKRGDSSADRSTEQMMKCLNASSKYLSLNIQGSTSLSSISTISVVSDCVEDPGTLFSHHIDDSPDIDTNANRLLLCACVRVRVRVCACERERERESE